MARGDMPPAESAEAAEFVFSLRAAHAELQLVVLDERRLFLGQAIKRTNQVVDAVDDRLRFPEHCFGNP